MQGTLTLVDNRETGFDTNNYTVKFVDGSLTINKRKVTLTSATDSKVYDGTELTSKDVAVSGDGSADGEGASYDVTGTRTAPAAPTTPSTTP